MRGSACIHIGQCCQTQPVPGVSALRLSVLLRVLRIGFHCLMRFLFPPLFSTSPTLIRYSHFLHDDLDLPKCLLTSSGGDTLLSSRWLFSPQLGPPHAAFTGVISDTGLSHRQRPTCPLPALQVLLVRTQPFLLCLSGAAGALQASRGASQGRAPQPRGLRLPPSGWPLTQRSGVGAAPCASC